MLRLIPVHTVRVIEPNNEFEPKLKLVSVSAAPILSFIFLVLRRLVTALKLK